MRTTILLGLLMAGTAAGSANAATIFSDRSLFNAGGAGTSTFSDLASGFTVNQVSPVAIGPLTFTGSILYVPDVNTTAGVNGAPNASAWLQYQINTGGSSGTVSAASFRLIGFDYRPYPTDAGETIRFTANTGETGTFTLPSTNIVGFVGIAFSSNVTSVTFSATNGGSDGFFSWFGTDNYQLWSAAAAAPAVPEPASWAMMIGGFALAGGALRKSRRNVAFA